MIKFTPNKKINKTNVRWVHLKIPVVFLQTVVQGSSLGDGLIGLLLEHFRITEFTNTAKPSSIIACFKS